MANVNFTVSTFLVILFLQTIPVRLIAQNYFVRLDIKESQCRLYMGYQNHILMPILHPHDTVNKYIFHANAMGADIDYDESGRMIILPYKKDGYVNVYAEMKSNYYYAGRFTFEGVQPPPNELQDDTFVSVMGITKEDSKNTLPSKKTFDIRNKPLSKMEGLEIEGFRSMDLRKGQPNLIKVTIYQKENEQYITQDGEIDILSLDAGVRKINNHAFQITLAPGKERCHISIYLNHTKIEENDLSTGR